MLSLEGKEDDCFLVLSRFCVINIYGLMIMKSAQGWKGISCDCYYSSRGPRFSSQHPHGDLKPFYRCNFRDPILSSDLESFRYTHSTHTYMQAKHSHVQLFSEMAKELEVFPFTRISASAQSALRRGFCVVSCQEEPAERHTGAP